MTRLTVRTFLLAKNQTKGDALPFPYTQPVSLTLRQESIKLREIGIT